MSGAKTIWKKEQVARFGFEPKKASNEEVAFQLAFLEDHVFAKVPFDCCCTPDVRQNICRRWPAFQAYDIIEFFWQCDRSKRFSRSSLPSIAEIRRSPSRT